MATAIILSSGNSDGTSLAILYLPDTTPRVKVEEIAKDVEKGGLGYIRPIIVYGVLVPGRS